jgi:hypothetical protein
LIEEDAVGAAARTERRHQEARFLRAAVTGHDGNSRRDEHRLGEEAHDKPPFVYLLIFADTYAVEAHQLHTSTREGNVTPLAPARDPAQ